VILLDTHTLIWAMKSRGMLSVRAAAVLDGTPGRSVSAASLYEIAYKGGRGKWPEVEDLLALDLEAALANDGIDVIPVSGAIMQRAGTLDWNHRDPFDRMIVVTALDRGAALVSKDATLDTVDDPAFRRVW